VYSSYNYTPYLPTCSGRENSH